jgi:archaellum component FlaC
MKRTSSVIPFGYKLSETNYSELEEVPEQKEALKKIVPMIQQRTLSLREL